MVNQYRKVPIKQSEKVFKRLQQIKAIVIAYLPNQELGNRERK